MTRAVAVAVLLATGARAADPVFDTATPAPAVSGPLVWKDQHGVWFSDAQTIKLDLRLKYLEDKAAKECTDATTAANRQLLGASSTTWILAGAALVVGAVGGFYVAKRF